MFFDVSKLLGKKIGLENMMKLKIILNGKVIAISFKYCSFEEKKTFIRNKKRKQKHADGNKT